MERSSLFRGKRIDDGKWVYGWYCKWPPLKDSIIPSKDAKNGYLHFEQIDPETLGEYTGLTDKNDVKIFEGDIVKKKDYLGMQNMHVGFRNGKFCCWYDGAWKYYTLDDSRIEVIGNIYDNPEMLVKK